LLNTQTRYKIGITPFDKDVMHMAKSEII